MLIRSEPVGSPRLGAWLAQAIYLLRSATPQQSIDAMVSADWGVNYRSRFFPQVNLIPAMYVSQQFGDVLVLIDGARFENQAQALTNGWLQPIFDISSGVSNPYINDLRDAVLGNISAGSFSPTTYFFLAGWSCGGCVVNAILERFAGLIMGAVPTIGVTFGAPRSTSRAAADTIARNATLLRWMTAEDVCPLLPPRSADFAGVYLLFTPEQIRRFNLFVQPNVGLSIDNAPTIIPSTLPTSAALNFAGAWASFYVEQDNNVDGPHAIGTYARRLGLVAGPSPVPSFPVPPDAERVGVVTTVEATRATAAIRGVVLNLERQQNAVAVSIPPERRAQAFRYNGLWYVRFQGETICCPGTRRRARSIANQLNHFLANLQSVAVVDPDALVAQLTSYLDQADVPLSGFQPTMNTRV